MDRSGKAIAQRGSSEHSGTAVIAPTGTSLELAERGVNSSGDFRNLMSALMTDVIRGSLSPEVTNAACNAGGKLLKMVELEYKYSTEPERRNRGLIVAGDRIATVASA